MINIFGMGIYSLGASSVVIDTLTDEQVEILVYTDDSRVQLITQLSVKPIIFEF